jgi:hypothetical protein
MTGLDLIFLAGVACGAASMLVVVVPVREDCATDG